MIKAFLLWTQGQKQDKKQEVQFFFVRLLVALVLASQLCFCLLFKAFSPSISLAIDRAEFISGEIAVSFSR